MEFKEHIFEGTAIIPGYESLFDRMVSSEGKDREDLKQQYGVASHMLWDAMTITDLYSAVQKVISIPPVEDEATMKSNLLKLSFTLEKIPLADRRPEVEQAIEFIEHRMMTRLNTLMGGPQPKIDGESSV
jgi:hypothetical protein